MWNNYTPNPTTIMFDGSSSDEAPLLQGGDVLLLLVRVLRGRGPLPFAAQFCADRVVHRAVLALIVALD